MISPSTQLWTPKSLWALVAIVEHRWEFETSSRPQFCEGVDATFSYSELTAPLSPVLRTFQSSLDNHNNQIITNKDKSQWLSNDRHSWTRYRRGGPALSSGGKHPGSWGIFVGQQYFPVWFQSLLYDISWWSSSVSLYEWSPNSRINHRTT